MDLHNLDAVIFLDVDGVLHNSDAIGPKEVFNSKNMLGLKRILDKTTAALKILHNKTDSHSHLHKDSKCEIVLSTMWRKDE